MRLAEKLANLTPQGSRSTPILNQHTWVGRSSGGRGL